MKKLDWNDKRNQKFKKEAEQKNLILIGDSEKHSHKFYRFKKCGHTKEIRVDRVRDNIFECRICIEIKHTQEASKAGFKFVKYLPKNGYAVYSCIKCKHVDDFQYTHIRNKMVECSECRKNKLIKEAKRKNLEIVGAGKKYDASIYRFKECGHEREIQHSHVRNESVTCTECYEIKLDKEAKAAGIKIIGKGTRGSGYRLYEFIKCGHRRNIEISKVRNQTFICRKCVKTFRDDPSNLYLLELKANNFKWLKLGYAKNIETRIKGYKLHKDVSLNIVKAINVGDGHAAYRLEAAIHKLYFKKKLEVKAISKFMKSGANECYPINMKKKLIEELKNIN